MRAFAAVCIVGAALAAAATAAPSVTVTIAASAPTVAYGGPLTLTGQVSTKKANQRIVVEATECGSTKATKVATVQTAANGLYTVAVKPTLGTSYRASFKNNHSGALAITVKPSLVLTKTTRGSFTANVTAGQALTGKFVLFQRYKKLRKRWVQVKRLALGAAVPGTTKPAMVSSVSFKAKLPRGTRVRLLISALQAKPCYVTATSKTLRA